jgi:hypothetical protein
LRTSRPLISLGQLAPAQFPLGDALEPGPLAVVGVDAALGDGPVRHTLTQELWSLTHVVRVIDDRETAWSSNSAIGSLDRKEEKSG